MSLNWLGTFATFVSLDLKDFYLSKGKCDQIAQAHRYALEQALSSSHGPIYVALSIPPSFDQSKLAHILLWYYGETSYLIHKLQISHAPNVTILVDTCFEEKSPLERVMARGHPLSRLLHLSVTQPLPNAPAPASASSSSAAAAASSLAFSSTSSAFPSAPTATQAPVLYKLLVTGLHASVTPFPANEALPLSFTSSYTDATISPDNPSTSTSTSSASSSSSSAPSTFPSDLLPPAAALAPTQAHPELRERAVTFATALASTHVPTHHDDADSGKVGENVAAAAAQGGRRIRGGCYLSVTSTVDELDNVLLTMMRSNQFVPEVLRTAVCATLAAPSSFTSTASAAISSSSSSSSLSSSSSCTPADWFVDGVVLGGTFDHLHEGHKVMLAAACAAARKRLLIGLTSAEMLVKKKYSAAMQSYALRKHILLHHLSLIRPSLEVEIHVLRDMYGPARDRTDVEVLYLSQETAEGGPLVNAERTRQGVPPLEVRAVPLAGPEQMKQQTVAESLTTSTAGASAPASSGGPAGSSAPSVLSSSSTSTSSPSSSWSAIAASKTSSTALRLAESARRAEMVEHVMSHWSDLALSVTVQYSRESQLQNLRHQRRHHLVHAESQQQQQQHHAVAHSLPYSSDAHLRHLRHVDGHVDGHVASAASRTGPNKGTALGTHPSNGSGIGGGTSSSSSSGGVVAGGVSFQQLTRAASSSSSIVSDDGVASSPVPDLGSFSYSFREESHGLSRGMSRAGKHALGHAHGNVPSRAHTSITLEDALNESFAEDAFAVRSDGDVDENMDENGTGEDEDSSTGGVRGGGLRVGGGRRGDGGNRSSGEDDVDSTSASAPMYTRVEDLMRMTSGSSQQRAASRIPTMDRGNRTDHLLPALTSTNNNSNKTPATTTATTTASTVSVMPTDSTVPFDGATSVTSFSQSRQAQRSAPTNDHSSYSSPLDDRTRSLSSTSASSSSTTHGMSSPSLTDTATSSTTGSGDVTDPEQAAMNVWRRYLSDYSSAHRKYHTLSHVARLLTLVDRLHDSPLGTVEGSAVVNVAAFPTSNITTTGATTAPTDVSANANANTTAAAAMTTGEDDYDGGDDDRASVIATSVSASDVDGDRVTDSADNADTESIEAPESDIITLDSKACQILKLAAFFHDVVYNPRRSDNETASAAVFRSFAVSQFRWPDSLIRVVNRIILDTASHSTDGDDDEEMQELLRMVRAKARHLYGCSKRGELRQVSAFRLMMQLFQDIDMEILSATREQYLEYLEGVVHEYQHVPLDKFIAGRTAVLNSFTQKPMIYGTPVGQLWEVAARRNVSFERENLETLISDFLASVTTNSTNTTSAAPTPTPTATSVVSSTAARAEESTPESTKQTAPVEKNGQ